MLPAVIQIQDSLKYLTSYINVGVYPETVGEHGKDCRSIGKHPGHKGSFLYINGHIHGFTNG
jgi:hypothetical protein